MQISLSRMMTMFGKVTKIYQHMKLNLRNNLFKEAKMNIVQKVQVGWVDLIVLNILEKQKDTF